MPQHITPSRREILRIGTLGSALTLADYLRLSATEQKATADRSAILLFLQGGPSHQDTFDLKPDAATEYRGEFRPIATNVPGIEICEHLPKLASMADKIALIRGVSHNLSDHGLGSRYVLTGNRPTPVIRYPAFGSVANRMLAAPRDVPTSVAIDEDLEGPGFLGAQYGSLATGEKPRYGQPFNVRGISLDPTLTLSRFSRRRQLATDVDTVFRDFEQLDNHISGLDRFSQQAFEIISSPRSREAFDLSRETPAAIDRFGRHETGQSLLLACRLIAAGVRFVTVLMDGWDTHSNNFQELKSKLLPQLDQSVTALFETLAARDLLETTAVCVTGEFGRTPKINGQAGRDHWARAMFSLFAGANVRGGQVVGATDATASEPVGNPYSPDDLAATFYQLLGINPRQEFTATNGRPVMLVRDGRILSPLLR